MKQKILCLIKKNKTAVLVLSCLSVLGFFIMFGNAQVEKPNAGCHDVERNYKCR